MKSTSLLASTGVVVFYGPTERRGGTTRELPERTMHSRRREWPGASHATFRPAIPIAYAPSLRLCVLPIVLEKMEIPAFIRDAATTFHDQWRHPRLSALEFSEIYSLFPQETPETPTNIKWPDRWPLADRPGVYLIFGGKMQLLYVGKAGWLGSRLSSYFIYAAGKGSGCRIVHSGWRSPPKFIATIAVAESFEAAALEEFLIRKLRPEENKMLVGSPNALS